MTRAQIPSTKEPPGLLRSDGKKSDGVSLIPWSRGRCLTWDVTVPDTVAASHIYRICQFASCAAEQAAVNKHRKYVQIMHSHDFVAVAVETFWVVVGWRFNICKWTRQTMRSWVLYQETIERLYFWDSAFAFQLLCSEDMQLHSRTAWMLLLWIEHLIYFHIFLNFPLFPNCNFASYIEARNKPITPNLRSKNFKLNTIITSN